MTVTQRIFAATALVSLALVASVPGASALTIDTHEGHARDLSQHERLAHMKRATHEPRANLTITAKVGLAWSNGEDDKLGLYITKKTRYIYSWAPTCVKSAPEYNLQCGRMLWGYRQLQQFRQLRDTPGTTILMGMNEVNEPSQSYMTYQQGVALWNAEIRPYGAKGIKLISPAVTSSPTGEAWFKGFFATCGGNDKCGVDALAIHYYGTNAQSMIAYITKFYKEFGLNIWVTEFGCQDFVGGPQASQDQVYAFMGTVTSWMDSQPWVEAYFAFGLLHDMWNVEYTNQLMKPDGSPTPLGYQFINA